jgi:hypothetical protein
MSKLSVPMSDFLITGLLEETNGQFYARVELAMTNIIGRYTHGEHKVSIEALPNGSRVNRVFEHAGMPYRPRLEPSSMVNAEAAKNRKKTPVLGPWPNVRKYLVRRQPLLMLWWRRPLQLRRRFGVNPWLWPVLIQKL